MTDRYVWVVGANLPFGGDFVARMRSDGLTVVAEVSALPDEAMLYVLVVNLTTASPDIRFRDVAEDDFRDLVDSQLYTFVDAVQAAVPRMATGGAIVLIGPKAHLGSWGGVQVAATAAACVGMARSMAIELAPRGIRVNTVATGRADEAWDTPEARADIAATVAWLAGADSAQITGETILVDRGSSLQMTQAARR